uniref:dual oxidase 1-like isoform X1 n=1 Tax=Styela clava TaxID=7725 RepID=UPI0019394D99|nr:dual oxidase 1-like isoform X1 [Styela clava]
MFYRIFLLLAIAPVTFGSDGKNHFSRFDGWYNNLFHTEWGTPGTAIFRIANEDNIFGTQSNVPNSRRISDAFRSVEDGVLSTSRQSVMLPFFAQMIVDDIVDTRRVACPAEYLNIRVPNTTNNDEKIMPVYRSKFDKKSGSSVNSPRNLANEATSWLDGSTIYGPSQSWSEHLREFRRGRLNSQGNTTEFPTFNYNKIPLINPTLDRSQHPMKRNPAELLSFGNPRGNENVFLMAVGIIWFRYHNFLAQRFASENPGWPDEKVFENARRWTVATYQNIALYEMLPALVENFTVPAYEGYNSLLDPAITAEFSAAAMRIGHSMIPAGVSLRRRNCSVVNPLPAEYMMSAGEPALRLCNTYWQLQGAITKHGIDDIIRGLISQTAERADHMIVDDLRDFLYGPLKRSRMDLLALTIERGRDAGLASYNNVRRSLGLSEIRSFSQFTGVPDLVLASITEVYRNNTNLLEVYVGGILESAANNNGADSLFGRIIIEQMVRLRNSDRYWFENVEEGYFSRNNISEIRNTTFRDVIIATTSIEADELQRDIFFTRGNPCPAITVVSSNFTRPCTANKGMNFFQGYWGKLAGSIILMILLPILSYIVMCGIAKRNVSEQKKEQTIVRKKIRKQSTRLCSTGNTDENMDNNMFTGFEIEGKNKSKPIVVTMKGKVMKILNMCGTTLRRLNVEKFNKAHLLLSQNKGKTMMVIRVPKEYDVVIRFSGQSERDAARNIVQSFLTQTGVNVSCFGISEKELLAEAVTKETRQELLDDFFRRVFGEVLNISQMSPRKKGHSIPKLASTEKNLREDIADCELTEAEFAETLGMKSGSLFVKQMFEMADTDKSGYLSMREVADLMVILMNGTPEQKAKMLFDMYDVDKSGQISRNEGRLMIKSFLEMASYRSEGDEIEEAIEAIFRQCGVGDKESLTEEIFTNVLMKDHRDAFARAKLNLPGVKQATTRKNTIAKERQPSGKQKELAPQLSVMRNRKKSKTTDAMSKQTSRITLMSETNIEDYTGWRNYIKIFKRFVENNRRHIFCIVIFYSITAALVIERATHYALKSEHTGIRQITEWGLIISRGAAAAISFHFSIILLTMCRNLITFCRETFLNNFIPFDAAVAFHKQIAYVAIVETGFHVFGHIINFYHLSVHPLPALACVFPKLLVDDGSDLPPPLVWWLYKTITGFTGILLVAVLSVIYVFAMQYSRRYCFRAFWMTHHLFVVLFILMILHGSVGLIQSPLFHFYLVGPAFIFTVDQLITLSRSKVDTAVVKADPLPSDVLNLVFKRPTGFDYRSGQWVRIACLSLGTTEYHPFTLTSAPHEQHLSVHIRAVGPWTKNVRRIYQEARDQKLAYPKLYLDGPFGEGHQDWYKYEVSILVGAGIGVTPFASILKDIVQKYKTSKGFQIACKKVYFIWVTRTQRHFEWLTDIIQDLEDADREHMVDTHIYITQFHHKFDLRTTMLYICERFFQKEANKSLFTGLQATTHFGRPQFRSFFEALQGLHEEVKQFGVFSCGPPGLTNDVESSSKDINRRGKSQFLHFFENF